MAIVVRTSRLKAPLTVGVGSIEPLLPAAGSYVALLKSAGAGIGYYMSMFCLSSVSMAVVLFLLYACLWSYDIVDLFFLVARCRLFSLRLFEVVLASACGCFCLVVVRTVSLLPLVSNKIVLYDDGADVVLYKC